MNPNRHTMSNLFAQLGLPDDALSIEEFITLHRPLGNEVTLCCASFWTDAQSVFIKEEIIVDLPRPRTYQMMATDVFGALRERIWHQIRDVP